MNLIKIMIVFGFFLPYSNRAERPVNYLQECWNKQVKPLDGRYLKLTFEESRNELEHSFQPWEETNYRVTGNILCGSDFYTNQDSLFIGGKSYTSKTQYNMKELLFINYGKSELFPVTKNMLLNQPAKTTRYSPITIISHFKTKNITADKSANLGYAVYTDTINKEVIKLYISKSDFLLRKVTILSDDELFGDVLTTINYNDFKTIQGISYPRKIIVQKINGKITDTIDITSLSISKKRINLIERPSIYKLVDDLPVKEEVRVEKYNNNINLIELKHTDDKTMIVEFDDFLLAAEAPLNSKNGELIIREAMKIAPNKPIKYFVFGHYHPHYLGGIRPFVHRGAKIIASKQDEEYVSYIVNSKHTLNPDSLQIDNKPLMFEEIKDSLTISDNRTEMRIYFIGKKSQHTKDYLIYYFPKEKLLFEDDLVWISKEGDIEKANDRQAGLYHAIKDLGIKVETIIQSWPVSDYGVKTLIPFEDLEKSMKGE